MSATAFTYQGRLAEGSGPANGEFDIQFELFATETGGMPTTASVTNSSVIVSNGIFTTLVDFDVNAFSNPGSWIQISVRRAGQNTFITLSPRQRLSPVPYSVHTLRAESLTGLLPDSQVSSNIARLNGDQTFTGGLTIQGPLRAASFAGEGAGLSNVSATALSARLAQRLWRVFIPFVNVTNAGNMPDSSGKGAVTYNFRIGKFEISHRQYAGFLNAIAAEDLHHLYVTNMTTDSHGGIIRSGNPGDYLYTVKPGKEHLPVVWVEFHSVLRFCNWLHNGQPTGPQDATTTEDGAYTLTSEAEAANTVARNPGARFWLPSDDEWYKAAYHHPAGLGGPSNDYWLFPTRADGIPFAETPPGGDNSVNACCETGQATPLGSYLNTHSFYGAYDLAGNVQEWVEEIIYVTNRRVRGGSFVYNEFYSNSGEFEFDTPDYDAPGIGFRVAGALEP